MRQLACLIVIALALQVSNIYAFRISRPPTFSLPWTQDQINQLNDSLQKIWNLTNGEFNLDIVATTKTNAENGDIWIITTGAQASIQFKRNGHIYTISQ